jgi:exodeoxyribonuclease-3
MRIATWNVNSLKARFERLTGWLERTSPDILLLQETKCGDAEAPRESLAELGYEIAHHGQGGRNGVAIVSRTPITRVETNFGQPLDRDRPLDGTDPFAEARIISGVVSGIQVMSLYAPNGRSLDTPFFAAKLIWFDRLSRWLQEVPKETLIVLGGDFNIAPTDLDVWDPRACHGGTHVSAEERAAFGRLVAWGLVDAYRLHHPEGDRYTWWDYRAGDFYKNIGMRIDHLLASRGLASRIVHSEIDREARKGRPTPSDHAPLLMDLDAPGRSFDAGWAGADERIAARRLKPTAPSRS